MFSQVKNIIFVQAIVLLSFSAYGESLLDQAAQRLGAQSSLQFLNGDDSGCRMKLSSEECLTDKEEGKVKIKDPTTGKFLNLKKSIELNSFFGGDREGNGGDLLAIEFKRLAFNVVTRVAREDNTETVNKLLKAISKVQINSADEIAYNGIKLSAINMPKAKPQRIILSRESWNKSTLAEGYLLDVLVLHEILPLIGILDGDYKTSLKLVGSELCYLDDRVGRQIIKDFKYRCSSVPANRITKIKAITFTADDNHLIRELEKLPSLKEIGLVVLDNTDSRVFKASTLFKNFVALGKMGLQVQAVQMTGVPCYECLGYFESEGLEIGMIVKNRLRGEVLADSESNRILNIFLYSEEKFLREIVRTDCNISKKFFEQIHIKRHLGMVEFDQYQNSLIGVGLELIKANGCVAYLST